MEIPSGDSIRAARKDNGLTQSDLAERADVSQPLIARVESEDVDPTIDTLYSIVSALNNSSSNLEQEEVQISMPSVLKDARSQAGYTQRELANIADVSQPLISRIERQDVNPRASTLRELFSHLDSQVDSGSEEPSMPSKIESDLFEKIESEFEKMRDSTSQSTVQAGESSNDRDSSQCNECSVDISMYQNPNYCPNCGSEL
ncbi:hypothetical protein DJ82_06660 [Halorubrum sp. Ib24]|uniref:helix-turn-helix domain-containing protein n=1 Tax=Halorubrum sp. Ib24 TaxID=1383850 RepID=UPI000BCE0E6C|nr:helix-turn-helix domain-containing protein [Halorubrum sp. Ib24]OYR40767.1 hypothetical protein DJ82_06660 [Halorubrum sp. Ib24]